jgi:hypothetical protein
MKTIILSFIISMGLMSTAQAQDIAADTSKVDSAITLPTDWSQPVQSQTQPSTIKLQQKEPSTSSLWLGHFGNILLEGVREDAARRRDGGVMVK